MTKAQNDTPLVQQATAIIISLYQLEKQLSSVYAKMEKAAATDELAKCLSPISTDAIQHLERLKLLQQSLQIKSITAATSKVSGSRWKKSNLEQDLAIIKEALTFQNQKLAGYEMLHPMFCAMELTLQAELVEQTITDNRNTNTWLRQIVQNILSPQLLDAEHGD